MYWVRFVSGTVFFWWAATRPGLVDIAQTNPNIRLDLRYATVDNFTHQRLYPAAVCLLQTATAERLGRVADDLTRQGLGLIVWDCYRPLSIQRRLWALVPDSRYVANPAQGSHHNRGAAVDVTLVGLSGNPLPMGSEFDDFTAKSHFDYAGLSDVEKRNRGLLRRAMEQQGFLPLATEWWHFDDPEWTRYPVLNVPLAGKGPRD